MKSYVKPQILNLDLEQNLLQLQGTVPAPTTTPPEDGGEPITPICTGTVPQTCTENTGTDLGALCSNILESRFVIPGGCPSESDINQCTFQYEDGSSCAGNVDVWFQSCGNEGCQVSIICNSSCSGGENITVSCPTLDFDSCTQTSFITDF